MKKLRKRVFIVAGYNTVSMGTGRREFNPKSVGRGIEDYMVEAGQGTLSQVGGAVNIDESIVGNFIAARFNRQANLPAFMPFVDKGLMYKPAVRVEGACGTGGLAILTAIRSILSETSEVVLVVGVEVQNTIKAVYGADVLAAAGWARKRKIGHAYFFPGQFSIRAGAYFKQFGRERTRSAMARWYKQAIENARLCPTAQEHHNTCPDLEAVALIEPDGESFVDHLNYADCSKVSDGASALVVVSEDGLKRIGLTEKDAVEVVGWAQAEGDITKEPEDPTILDTMKYAVSTLLNNVGVPIDQVATVETHDCFSIAGLLAVEATGLARHGGGPEYILSGATSREGEIPFNTTGGLIGWGHPTGATGVHQAVTIWEQLTGRAGTAQIQIPENKSYGLSINMGGDDKTLVTIMYRRAA